MKNWTNEMTGEDIIGSFVGGVIGAAIIFGLIMALLYAPLLAKLAIAFIATGGVLGTYIHHRAYQI